MESNSTEDYFDDLLGDFEDETNTSALAPHLVAQLEDILVDDQTHQVIKNTAKKKAFIAEN